MASCITDRMHWLILLENESCFPWKLCTPKTQLVTYCKHTAQYWSQKNMKISVKIYMFKLCLHSKFQTDWASVPRSGWGPPTIHCAITIWISWLVPEIWVFKKLQHDATTTTMVTVKIVIWSGFICSIFFSKELSVYKVSFDITWVTVDLRSFLFILTSEPGHVTNFTSFAKVSPKI